MWPFLLLNVIKSTATNKNVPHPQFFVFFKEICPIKIKNIKYKLLLENNTKTRL